MAVFRVAHREAWLLTARRSRGVAIVDADELGPGGVSEPADPRDLLGDTLRLRAALEQLRQLPPRLQTVVLLNAQFGTYAEVAAVLGVSRSRVNNMLADAAVKLQLLADRRTAERPLASPRAARLREFEETPPPWLTAAIGRPPTASRSGSIVLARRRAALAIDDYRTSNGVRDRADALGHRPHQPERQRAFDAVARLIDQVAHERERRSGRELAR